MRNDNGVKFSKYGDDVEALAKFLTALAINGAAIRIDDLGDSWKVYVLGG